MHEIIEPIRKASDRIKFKQYWYQHSPMGPRNWMMFQLGIVTALRASDICKLRIIDAYDRTGIPRTHLIGHDIKTHKANQLLITPLYHQLITYREWLEKQYPHQPWLFPTYGQNGHRTRPNYLYKAMHNAASALGLRNVGSHSLRKTFGYLAYKKTHDIVYVMKMLNHSNPDVTLRYIGIEYEAMDNITKNIFKYLN